MNKELNEALDTLHKAGFITEAKASWEKFLPKDSDTIQDLATKGLEIKRSYDKASNNDKYILAQIYNDIIAKMHKLNKKKAKTVKAVEDDEPEYEDNLPSNEDRADDDGGYMGSYYEHYGLNDPCSDEEWAAAGKRWARDARKNGDLSKEDYKDAVEHYKYYRYES